MQTTETTIVEAVRSMTNKELVAAVVDLQNRVAQLEAQRTSPNASANEMTDEMAKRVLNGDLANVKHKDAAAQLNLTYGQVYSCRLGFTFKPVHKELKDSGFKNPWVK